MGILLNLSFFNNFETHIEPRIHDQQTLFFLLLQHCSNNAQDQISHLAGNQACYQQAKQKLIREYNSSWIISVACYKKLKSFWNLKVVQVDNFNPFANS